MEDSIGSGGSGSSHQGQRFNPRPDADAPARDTTQVLDGEDPRTDEGGFASTPYNTYRDFPQRAALTGDDLPTAHQMEHRGSVLTELSQQGTRQEDGRSQTANASPTSDVSARRSSIGAALTTQLGVVRAGLARALPITSEGLG